MALAGMVRSPRPWLCAESCPEYVFSDLVQPHSPDPSTSTPGYYITATNGNPLPANHWSTVVGVGWGWLHTAAWPQYPSPSCRCRGSNRTPRQHAHSAFQFNWHQPGRGQHPRRRTTAGATWRYSAPMSSRVSRFLSFKPLGIDRIRGNLVS